MSEQHKLIARLEEILGDKVAALSPISGGDINEARKIKTPGGQYFLKFNRSSNAGDMFQKEAKGLRLLADSNSLQIPQVVATGSSDNISFLILEFIENGSRTPEFWVEFGEGLAKMHHCTRDTFGLDHNNYIGRLHQRNNPHESWVRFFIEERLQPQIDLAALQDRITVSEGKMFDLLFAKLEDLLDAGTPALLHGDLWSGNFICGIDNKAVLVDPAVYYGHPEADLAMTRLFGGFSPTFYESYINVFPLAPGWESRLEIYQLYYLLVHVNLFGRSYMSGILHTLRKFL